MRKQLADANFSLIAPNVGTLEEPRLFLCVCLGKLVDGKLSSVWYKIRQLLSLKHVGHEVVPWYDLDKTIRLKLKFINEILIKLLGAMIQLENIFFVVS